MISISQSTAQELGNRENAVRSIEHDIRSLDELKGHMIEYALRQKGEGTPRLRSFMGVGLLGRPLSGLLDELLERSASKEEFEAGRSALRADLERKIQDIEDMETTLSMTTFAGTVKKIPAYVPWLMKNMSSGKVVSFKEVRKAVGREEASQLLELKLRRGGTQSLARIQETVRALLGVEVDAFQSAENTAPRPGQMSTNAEMDIDDFLVEANGAGIREALRIILDLELGNPVLATVEEPEVHLHPGLERVVHRYLVEKSRPMQLFVATHSTNFLDSTTRQNVYLVSRRKKSTSIVEKVASESDLILMSQEIGLRPSTVLMFDRLIFVEGPSDEAIFIEISKKLELDFAHENATFIQMGGSTGLAHFAADATIDLLSRRRIKMWFIIDNDERSESDIKRIVERLGDRARVVVLKKRELENYVIDRDAIFRLLSEKASTAGGKNTAFDRESLQKSINSASAGLLERTVQLNVEKSLLAPIYARYGGDTVGEKLEAMANAALDRAKEALNLEKQVRESLSAAWPVEACNKAPGSEILEAVLKDYGFSYNKSKDGPRLARLIEQGSLDREICDLLCEITKPDDPA